MIYKNKQKHRIMKAIGYRYNSKERSHRRFNCCGREKNPNQVRFFARTLEAAEPYRYIYYEDGDVWYECELEVVEIEGNFFNMEAEFSSLAAYKQYVASKIEAMRSNYIAERDNSKTAKRRKMFQNLIDGLVNEERSLICNLFFASFQQLSDFEHQHSLIAELRGMGYDGYFTKDEIAVF